MINFIFWIIMSTAPLIFFLAGIKEGDTALIYISYLIYMFYIFIGLISYNKYVISVMVERQREVDIMSKLAVPEWLNLFSSLISVFTLVYYERSFLAFMLLVSAYGNYRLYSGILSKINKIEVKNEQ